MAHGPGLVTPKPGREAASLSPSGLGWGHLARRLRLFTVSWDLLQDPLPASPLGRHRLCSQRRNGEPLSITPNGEHFIWHDFRELLN